MTFKPLLGGVNPEPEPEPEPDTHEYVDLGLPSGTLWATENIKDEDGNLLFFAWGETSGYTGTVQRTFDWNNYQWGNPDNGTLVTDEIVDVNGNLKPEYDAATVNWGPNWRMPTKEEFEELIANTDLYVDDYSIGFNGGGTGFVINMPGYIEGDRFVDYENESYVGGVWASTVRDDYRPGAYNLFGQFSYEHVFVYNIARFTGMPVHPVRK